MEASHMNLCEFSKRPVKPPLVILDDIEPKQLPGHHVEKLSEEVQVIMPEQLGNGNEGDNLSSVSSGSMATQSIRTSDIVSILL